MMLQFYKMHGLGNDFVIVDARGKNIDLSSEDARKIGDRRRGVGCDQLVIIRDHEPYDCSMEIFNNDGSRAEACGNATRCVALLLNKPSVEILSSDRVLKAILSADGKVSVNMGLPNFAWDAIPMSKFISSPFISFGIIPKPILNQANEFKGESTECTLVHEYRRDPQNSFASFKMGNGINGFERGVVVNVGNPHLIFFKDNIKEIDVKNIGSFFEKNELFPEGVNVSFAEVIDRKTIDLRVWERGAGETLACGTAACATFAAARYLDEVDSEVAINLPGGLLSCTEDVNGNIHMSGEAKFSFKGEISIDSEK